MQNKIFIKIIKLWGIIFVVIFFYKRIYPYDFFHLDHNLEDDDENISLSLEID